MKKISLLILVMLLLTACQSSAKIKMLEKTEKHDETVSKVFEMDKTVYKRVGNNEAGYIDIEDSFIRFFDVVGGDSSLVQYSKTDKDIVSISKLNLSLLTDEERNGFTSETAITNIGNHFLQLEFEIIDSGKSKYENLLNGMYLQAKKDESNIYVAAFSDKDNSEVYLITIEGSEDFVLKQVDKILPTWSKQG